MRCSACNKEMTDKEVTWNTELDNWELCTECLDIAMEAAYTGQFKSEDDVYELLEDEFDDWEGVDVTNYGLEYEPYQEEFRFD